ncbi:hypothetical protein [Flavobacterium sp.]|jgi:hypothetical protein|uniref:hypothetical protein n=1 Tax=Flavobacterium sp. TaxID=239 RepID=UPI0037C144C9
MRNIDIHWKVVNKLLNRTMKVEYNYDYVFYLNPVQYIMNRELISDYYIVNEVVSINIKNNIKMFEFDKLSKDLRECLNYLLPMIEGSDFRRVNKVIVKVKRPVVSGTLFGTI